MTSNKFPSTSIGRSQGASLSPSSTTDSFTAHPLLSPGDSQTIPRSTSPAPSYVPYTRRQRPSATTGTTLAQPSASQPSQENATGKLQLMNLKAAAQSMGLDGASAGWLILEKLVSDNHEQDWIEIWTAVTTGKATLLLPTERQPHDRITPSFVKDHVIFWDSPARKNSQVVTLSGLRGVLNDDSITIYSTIHPTSKLFHELAATGTRSGTLARLPTLPTSDSFPTYTITSFSDSLPLPPRPPPLPPRATRPQPTGRISNPFASLFGNKDATPTPPPRPSSPSPSAHSIESIEPTSASAFVIDRAIVFNDLARDLTRGIKKDIRNKVPDTPHWLVERVNDFTSFLYPIIKAADKTYQVNPFDDTPEEIADIFQDFYETLERDLQADTAEKDRVHEILEVVEGAMIEVFYDRLFMQPTADDHAHDEALSNRIAALNVLDLTLEHLDIKISMDDIEDVVKECGELLSEMNLAHNAGKKAALMIASHKIVVDGLSKLAEKQDSPTKARPPATSSPEPIEPPTLVNKQPQDDIPEANIAIPESPSTSPTPTPTPAPPPIISSDTLFPLLIFSVVKANPPRFVSNLLLTQRFRNGQSASGEEGFCLTNLMAVAEFLEHVDMAALGLGDATNTVADLTPIPIPIPNANNNKSSPAASILNGGELLPNPSSSEAESGLFKDTANKMLSTSFGMFKSLLPSQLLDQEQQQQQQSGAGGTGVSGSIPRPTFGLLRRDSNFSIASMLPGGGTRSEKSGHGEHGEEMSTVSVSRPSSEASDGETSSGESEDDDDGDEEEEEEEDEEEPPGGDARSIKSFESMMRKAAPRKSLADRLVGLAPKTLKSDAARTSRPHTPLEQLQLAPPNKRFLECSPGDLKISEVADLLAEYRRIVEGVRNVGGFVE